jgi:hypothetical protein
MGKKWARSAIKPYQSICNSRWGRAYKINVFKDEKHPIKTRKMARKPRLEFEGAIYHIINRGNYREVVFGTKGVAGAFKKALIEAAEKYQWVIHAYVVMSNHFHLAVETPEGNLVSGMAWLQGTYANRFN